MAAPDHYVVEKWNNAKRLQSRKVANTALEEDFIDQENAGDKLVQFNEQTREIQRAHQRTFFHARSSQREASNASDTPNVPDDLSNRPFENRTNSPGVISAVGKLDIRGNARETQQDYSSKKGPRSPSQPFPIGRKRGSESNPNRSPDQDTEPRTLQQSKAQIMDLQGAEEYWRGPAKPSGHSSLFDPDRDSPLTSSPTATRVYDPRTHIFRSKKAYESKPGVLPAPDSLHTRPYSTAGHKRVSSSLEFDSERYHDHQPPGGFLPYDSFNERDPSLLLQPETRPISQEQLVNEVKEIYAGLVMVEKKCVEIDNQQAQNQAEGRQIKLSHEQWQALIALHRTLLHEHHDFFLASQHPSASPALRKLAAKYAMPARMWRHGIHLFLELLRHRLPDSLDHMLAFVYLAYSMMALLKESVPAFEDTWIECLGDLARYRMAIEDEDLHTRPYSTAGHKRVSSSLEYEADRFHYHQPPGGFLPYDNFNERDPSILLQPETRPISQEQLVNEVKGIYAGLVMVEKKCAEIDNQQTQNQTEGCQIKSSHEQQQALITSHRTLLHERSDSSLASQHPSASSALRRLAAKSGVTHLLRSLKIRDHNHAQRNGTGRTTKNITNNRELPKTKHVLSGLIGGIPVCALPDTGAQANFISARLVRKLGYVADFNVESQDNFSLVNGSSLKSYGKIQLPWKFAKEPETYSLTFRVVDNQLDEIVLGSSFLIETETLTGNPHRLSKQPDRDRNRYGLCNIGSPTQHVPGFLDEIHVSAFADTGCQLNIMSENYAAALNYDIIGAEDERVVFELPNGSIVPSPGYVEARFAFEDDPTKETLMYFDILPDSNYDIILGSDTLFENDVFMENSNRIVPGIPLSELPELLLVGFFIERRRKHQLERLQGEEREDAAGEDHRRFWAQKDIEECQEATARQALEAEDIKLHEEWQERSARRRQQMQVLANSPRVALPTSGSRTSQAGPKPRRRLLFWGRT